MIYIGYQKISNEEFLRRIKERNPTLLDRIEILEEYKGINEKLKCRNKETGEIFYKTPHSLYVPGACNIILNGGYLNKLNNKTFKEKFKERNKRNIKIIGEYVNYSTKIECECELGHRFQSTPNKLIMGCGCPYCSGKKVLKGFNTIGDKYPQLIQYFKTPEEAFEYTCRTNKKVMMKCPNCGNEKEVILSDLTIAGKFFCGFCSDGVSTGNKFLRNVLEYKKDILDYYKYEYCPKWENTLFRYDGYFVYKGKKYIWEQDGKQHYTEKWCGKKINAKENDKEKEELALRNGIDYFVRMNVSETTLDFYKEEWDKSVLKNIFNLTDKEFKEIWEKSQNSYFKMVVDLYNSDININQKGITEKTGIDEATVSRYIKRAEELGIIIRRRGKYQGIQLRVIDNYTGQEYLFNSITEAMDFFKEEGTPMSFTTLKKYLEGNDTHKQYGFEKLM